MTYHITKQLPVFVENIGSPKQLKDLISDYRKSIEGQHYESNVKAWHSGYLTHKETNVFDKVIQMLLYHCDNIIGSYYNNTFIKHECIHMWVIQYQQNDHAVRHSHYPADYSCIYYVDVEEDCAPLIVEGQLKIQPKTGTLVIFPGILDHEVPPTKSSRTVVAFNLLKTFTEAL